jgi:hypothetical protein
VLRSVFSLNTGRDAKDYPVRLAQSKGLSEKLTGLQLVRKYPLFYGTRRFITAFTSASRLSLS